MTVKEKIKALAEKYGYDAQSRQCIEEMAELTQAINKLWRKQLGCGEIPFPDDPDTFPSFGKEYDNLVEEIADVQIMLWQMERFLHCNIDSIVERKLDRQMERIGNKNSD